MSRRCERRPAEWLTLHRPKWRPFKSVLTPLCRQKVSQAARYAGVSGAPGRCGILGTPTPNPLFTFGALGPDRRYSDLRPTNIRQPQVQSAN